MTCGSVDDGKSTLIGRLLYECGAVPEDELTALARDSRTYGTRDGDLDFALLLDGLQAEREQTITIDVAYRYFATPRRRFIVADAPGHEQYTRNMVTAASTSELAVLLVDASKGVLTQTRRHACVAALVGIRKLVLAVNKMDLVGYDPAVFHGLAEEFRDLTRRLDVDHVVCIPLCALRGENLTTPSPALAWYEGPALLPYLERVDAGTAAMARPFRLPVQLVERLADGRRGYSGTIATGRIRLGDPVVVAPSGRTTRIAGIVTAGGECREAIGRDAVTVTLADEVDVGRGDVIAAADAPPDQTDQVLADVFWMHETPMLPKRQYLVRIGHQLVTGQVTEIKHRINIDTLAPEPAGRLLPNDIGACVLTLDRTVAVDPFSTGGEMGTFVMIDRRSNDTVAGGIVRVSLPARVNVSWQAVTVDRAARAAAKRQKPCVVWFTGLSGAGKSTIANLVESWLSMRGQHTYLLDGDNLRHGLNRDLGFSDEDRVENVRRVAEVARLMADAGLIVLVSLISPFRAERELARAIVEHDQFIEVYVDTPLAVCEARDPKGLYRRARAGEIRNFTGIDSAYEPPLDPELVLTGSDVAPATLAERVVELLRQRGIVD
jgi:bifunctional enzyme CysN/CysC